MLGLVAVSLAQVHSFELEFDLDLGQGEVLLCVEEDDLVLGLVLRRQTLLRFVLLEMRLHLLEGLLQLLKLFSDQVWLLLFPRQHFA